MPPVSLPNPMRVLLRSVGSCAGFPIVVEPGAFVFMDGWRLTLAAQVMMLRLEVERKLSWPRPHMRTDVFHTTEPHADISPHLHQL